MNIRENSNFKRLIGIWKTSGEIISDSTTQVLSGTDSYEFILDGNYILHKAAVLMGNEKSETFEIIGIDNSSGKAKMHYFNSRGESGIMKSTIDGNNFLINGKGLKFEGTINAKNTEVSGYWFLQKENKEWTKFIDLKLEKENL